MIQTALLSFYRTVQRHPFYAALNLLGLSFGIAVFITLSLFVRFETGYERWLPEAGQIYEATTQVSGTEKKDRPPTFGSAGLFLDAIRKDFPGIVGTRVAIGYMNVRYRDQASEETGQLVDPDFFKVFDIELIDGDKATALNSPDGLLISERMALKYFGTVKAVGRSLEIGDDGYYDMSSLGEVRQWRVTGVIRALPRNTGLRFDFLRLLTPYRKSVEPYWNTWSVARQRSFIRLPDPQAAEALNARMDDIVRSNGEILRMREKGILSAAEIHVRVLPLVDEHLMAPQARAGVMAMTTAAITALCVALINYVNLSTVRAGIRAREVAMRKSVGATGRGLRLQFVLEDTVAATTALVLGLSLVELALPAITRISQTPLSLNYITDAPWLLALCAIVLGTGLLASVYPAFVLSSTPAAAVLASSRFTRSPGHARVREALVVLQFFVVGALFVVLMGLAAQLSHLQTSKLGFNRNHILITNSTISQYVSPDDVRAVHDEWRRIPGVVGVGAGNVPGPTHLNGKVLVRPLRPGARSEIVQFEGTAGDFFKAYGTSLVVGRLVTEDDNNGLDPRHPAPLDKTVNIDINEVAAHTFGFTSPAAAIGQDLAYQNGRLHIVGVVADQRMDTPEIRIWPCIYSYRTTVIRDASTVVRFEGVADADMRERLIAAWRTVKGDRPISFVTMREALDSYYSDDRRNTRLMAIGSLAAGVIGAIGLFGMAAFSASTRTIEIGIRKSVGASHWQVSRLLVLQFLKPVVLGNLLSWPLAYSILNAWLGQFDDRTAVSPWFFLASLGISVTIAVTTVGAIAFSAASVPPSKALRQR